ncbi:MAG TPA: Fic family protein [Burkholderiaceae bacterium]
MAPKKPLPYLWQQPGWPALTFDHERVGAALAEARRMQGLVEGKAQAIGLEHDGLIARSVMEAEVVATAAIEGEKLDPEAVRSSVMRGLGLTTSGPRDRSVDGLVGVINDASKGSDQPLDDERLYRWQSALFPGGTSGLRRIAVGRYRDHEDPMQIVSGPPFKEVVHYEAPPSRKVPAEMRRLLAWFARTRPTPERPPKIDGLARAAVAHLWFETIHPFEDGNGRIGRALVDMALAQDHGSSIRLYSLSRQLLESRGSYYDALNAAQRGNGDVTDWVIWFAQQYALACARSSQLIDGAIEKARFWAEHANAEINERQRKVLQRLLDDGDGGFLGGLNAEKYIKLTHTSKPSATRDLGDLVKQGLLWTQGQGKALRYYVAVPGWTHGVDRASR